MSDFEDFQKALDGLESTFIRRVLESQNVDLSQFWELSDEVKNRKWAALWNRWQDDVVAQLLASFENDRATLPLLTELTPDAPPLVLARLQGRFDEVLSEAIRSRNGDFNYLSELTVDVAAGIARWKGTHCYLNGLTSLSDKAAEALAKWNGDNLCLDGHMFIRHGRSRVGQLEWSSAFSQRFAYFVSGHCQSSCQMARALRCPK